MNNDASDGSISRRHLLVLTAGTAAVAACGGPINTADGSTDSSADASGTTDAADDSMLVDDTGSMCTPDPNNLVGMVTDFPMGTWTQVDASNLIVGQDANGLFAYSDLCTHDRCPVNPPAANGNTYCACHGSRFDGNGAVLVGPATRPLSHYALTVCDGSVYVDQTMRVAATSRTPPG